MRCATARSLCIAASAPIAALGIAQPLPAQRQMKWRASATSRRRGRSPDPVRAAPRAGGGNPDWKLFRPDDGSSAGSHRLLFGLSNHRAIVIQRVVQIGQRRQRAQRAIKCTRISVWRADAHATARQMLEKSRWGINFAWWSGWRPTAPAIARRSPLGLQHVGSEGVAQLVRVDMAVDALFHTPFGEALARQASKMRRP